MTKTNDDEPPEPRAPEPYEPPAVLWEEPFVPVTMAVSCARFPGQGATCDLGPGT